MLYMKRIVCFLRKLYTLTTNTKRHGSPGGLLTKLIMQSSFSVSRQDLAFPANASGLTWVILHVYKSLSHEKYDCGIECVIAKHILLIDSLIISCHIDLMWMPQDVTLMMSQYWPRSWLVPWINVDRDHELLELHYFMQRTIRVHFIKEISLSLIKPSLNLKCGWAKSWVEFLRKISRITEKPVQHSTCHQIAWHLACHFEMCLLVNNNKKTIKRTKTSKGQTIVANGYMMYYVSISVS